MSEQQEKSLLFNLGLFEIHGSATADNLRDIFLDALLLFGIDIEKDIVGITCDGASVLVKFLKYLNCIPQLCLAHGIHLAVIESISDSSSTEIEAEDSASECNSYIFLNKI